MRKIKTAGELNKNKKRNQIIVGAVLVILMIISTAGYAFMNDKESDTSTTRSYNGLKFYRVGGSWQVVINGNTLYFQNFPNDTNEVQLSGNFNLSSYSGKPLYFVNSNAASQEILADIGKYTLRYQEACLNNTGCENLPVKSCKDNVIVFDLNATETKVRQENNCVYISGDFIKASDAFIYRLFGIK